MNSTDSIYPWLLHRLATFCHSCVASPPSRTPPPPSPLQPARTLSISVSLNIMKLACVLFFALACGDVTAAPVPHALTHDLKPRREMPVNHW